jgi:hypothetical protein
MLVSYDANNKYLNNKKPGLFKQDLDMIDDISKKPVPLNMIALSLLVHASKSMTNSDWNPTTDMDKGWILFKEFCKAFLDTSVPFKLSDDEYTPKEAFVNNAKRILKNDSSLGIFAEIASISEKQLISQWIDGADVHFVQLNNPVIFGWCTPTGICINSHALNLPGILFLKETTAFLSLMSHELMHYVLCQTENNFDVSTHTSLNNIYSEKKTADKNESTSEQHFGSGDLFEMKFIGALYKWINYEDPYYDYAKLLKLLNERIELLNEDKLLLPLIQEKEKEEFSHLERDKCIQFGFMNHGSKEHFMF